MTRSIVLASSSKYRQQLLQRLHLNFVCQAPDIDESEHPNETPLETAIRLAYQKAWCIANEHPEAIVIGSDQVANVNGKAISKPGNHEAAQQQLLKMSGQTIVFHTAACVICKAMPKLIEFEVSTQVSFRALSEHEIERYLLADTPYDCAGSAKSESLGIALLESIESTDPTALVGLPLIRLSNALRNMGIDLP
jgi:septum formation protein